MIGQYFSSRRIAWFLQVCKMPQSYEINLKNGQKRVFLYIFQICWGFLPRSVVMITINHRVF